jgi:hypothetical protein
VKWVVARFAAVATLLWLTALPTHAQSGTSSLTGLVTDPQQAVLPGASVTLTNTATGASRAVVTNDSGIYGFSAVQPGTYTLKVELSGFRTALIERLELRVDTQGRADVPLVLGGVNESVSVTAEPPLVNRTDASLGNTLNETAIRNLPSKRATSSSSSACRRAWSSSRRTIPQPWTRATARRTARAPTSRR